MCKREMRGKREREQAREEDRAGVEEESKFQGSLVIGMEAR